MSSITTRAAGRPGAGRRVAAMALALAGTACAGSHRPPSTAPTIASDAIEHSLFLIGDAGVPAGPADPVLGALRAMLTTMPGRSTVVFLGDNLYPLGMPDTGAVSRPEAERRITTVLNAVPESSRAYLVHGNHDWRRGRPGGWETVRRLEAFVASAGRPNVAVLPGGGCPGPASREVSRGLRLILLDTQWWLQSGERPEDPTSTCATDSKAEITTALRTAVQADTARLTVVVGHHPVASGGVHGGKFDWRDHLFPLRAWKSWMWLPLPIIGSLYPLVRGSGVSAQDLPSGRYGELADSLRAAFAARPPLAYATGHEHNLQVLRGSAARYLLISGTGSWDHTDKVYRLPQTVYGHSAPGFLRLDVLTDGRVRLGVITVEVPGEWTEDFAMWLNAEGS